MRYGTRAIGDGRRWGGEEGRKGRREENQKQAARDGWSGS